jgi:DNA-binding transcriptional LysR family regulator
LHALQIYSRQSPHRILSINPGARAGEFLAMYPELRLQFQMHKGDGLPRERSVDLSIRGGPLEDSGFLMKSIIRIRLGAYARPVYFENREVPSSPSHLRQHSCITKCGMSGDPGDGKIWQLCRGTEVKEITIESRISLPDPTTQHQLAVAGVGVALLSQSLARGGVDEDRLVQLLPEWSRVLSSSMRCILASELFANGARIS